MIYQSTHQAPTMSSTQKTSPRPQLRKFETTAAKQSVCNLSDENGKKDEERCRGRCRVQWSEKHVKEGLVLVQEAQLARVVKTGPISEHYEIDAKPFASGQWARVYRCRSRSTGALYAAKYSSRNRFNSDCSAELRHEIALLSLCSQSPRVVRLHDVYETPKEIILVMEYAPGGDLQTLIDGDLVPLEGDVVHFVKQLVEGLAYLHQRNIAHLDIKPQNLVMMGTFPECDVKLCDFEISRVVLEGTEVREILGTPDYVAPEILHYEPITLAADMWSLGVTTYVLLTGFSPFGGETDQETFKNISQGEVDFPDELFEDISAQARDFIAKLLVLDPSARMSAKQCLRHEWLHGAPTQASPHLRKYLSKSREVLLERVVSRENLRRAALLSQATSHANLMESSSHSQDPRFCHHLSQSEMCLNSSLTGSHASLTNSECYMSSADSQTSLNSSQNSLATSQSYLLNKEQTQGLLNQAQSRSQASINSIARRGLLSRMRSLNQIQSQACLLNTGKTTPLPRDHMNQLFTSKSQEKLYGLKCLSKSKSQGVLDIYRSLECLRNNDQKRIGKIGKNFQSPKCQSEDSQKITTEQLSSQLMENTTPGIIKDCSNESDGQLDSLQSIESDTLTEDSDDTTALNNKNNELFDKQPSQRQHSNISSHSNNSGNSDDKDDQSDSENNKEPKYTVAQLVSAFNKHQEVASKTSLESIMTEKRVNEVTFPTGPKALRLFIPDINISERTIVRRKTSYKPRKNWEELRKQNEKNEAVLVQDKDYENDSGNEDDQQNKTSGESDQIKQDQHIEWSSNDNDFPVPIETTLENRDTRIDEKYKNCVDNSKSAKVSDKSEDKEDKSGDSTKQQSQLSTGKPQKVITSPRTLSRCSYQKERLPNYIYPEVITNQQQQAKINNNKYSITQMDSDSTVNLKDILQKTDTKQAVSKENLEKLRKRTSIAKVIVNDKLSVENDTNNNNSNNGSNRAKSEPPAVTISKTKEMHNTKQGNSSVCTRSTSKELEGQEQPGQRKASTASEPSRNEHKRISSSTRGKTLTTSHSARSASNTKIIEPIRKTSNLLTAPQTEKIRRRSSPNMPPNAF